MGVDYRSPKPDHSTVQTRGKEDGAGVALKLTTAAGCWKAPSAGRLWVRPGPSLTGGLHTHEAGVGVVSTRELSTMLCWLLWESEYTVEPWPLSKVLSAGEDRSRS